MSECCNAPPYATIQGKWYCSKCDLPTTPLKPKEEKKMACLCKAHSGT